MRDAEMYEKEDKMRGAAVDIRNEGEALIYQTEKLLSEEGKEMDKEKKKRVKNDPAALVKAVKHTKIDKITDGQAEEIRRAKEQLERTLEE